MNNKWSLSLTAVTAAC